MIIAECGQNWQQWWQAAELIVHAMVNGADAAKFQLYDTDKIYKPNTDLYTWAKQCELTKEQARDLFKLGERVGIEVFFSVFDTERVKWCEELGVKRIKIAYSQRSNQDLIHKVLNILPASQVIISSQVDTTDFEVECANYLYCIPHYPAKFEDLKFSEVLFNGNKDDPIDFAYKGFSDHTYGLEAAKIAIARGAQIIEKHFSFSNDPKSGPDAPWSMVPSQLRELKTWEQIVKTSL
jgi:sialic acid synthase SpsE